MSFDFDLLYSYEQKIKDATKADFFNDIDKLYIEYSQKLSIDFPDADIYINVINTYFSEDLFDLLVNHNLTAGGLTEKDEKFVERNKQYIEELWGVSLQNTDVFFLDTDSSKADGWAFPCKIDEHFIVLPNNLETSFLSDDNLIHELGHIVEFYLRRQKINKNRVTSHKFFSEAIAHYGQFKYLSTQSLEERISAVASILSIAPLLEIIRYCHDNNTPHWEINDVVMSDSFKVLRKFYSIEKLKFLIKEYENQSVSEIYYYYVEPRLGAILALYLLDNHEAIKSLCFAETNKNVKDILEELGLPSDELLNFQNADMLLKKFIYQK